MGVAWARGAEWLVGLQDSSCAELDHRNRRAYFCWARQASLWRAARWAHVLALCLPAFLPAARPPAPTPTCLSSTRSSYSLPCLQGLAPLCRVQAGLLPTHVEKLKEEHLAEEASGNPVKQTMDRWGQARGRQRAGKGPEKCSRAWAADIQN